MQLNAINRKLEVDTMIGKSACAHKAKNGWKMIATIRLVDGQCQGHELLRIEGHESYVLRMLWLAGWEPKRQSQPSGDSWWYEFEPI